MQDLAPKKDAKGGGRIITSQTGKKDNANALRPEPTAMRGG